MSLLTDYDQTLTKAKFSDGSPCDSSFKTIIDYRGTPKSVKEETAALYRHYLPIERDTRMSREDKMAELDKWWMSDMKAFTSAAYSKSDFAQMTRESKLLFRNGTLELLEMCQAEQVQLLLVSGGIYELIEESLRLLLME